MKKYTEDDLKNFEVIDGYLICPTGDYSEIKIFEMKCSFGEGCMVENIINLANFLKFEGFGSVKRCTYFFSDINNDIFVRCGCFFGSLEEFRKKVKETYSNNKIGLGYLKAAELAEWQLLS